MLNRGEDRGKEGAGGECTVGGGVGDRQREDQKAEVQELKEASQPG